MATRVAVIGGGIAGLSFAAHAAEDHEVTVIEAEAQPGYHSSGRSAATYIEPYLNETIRALSAASYAFFTEPPAGFSEHPICAPRQDIMIARAARSAAVDRYLATWGESCPQLREISFAEARARVPILREEAVARAVLDERVMDLDVHALMEGFRRRHKALGGALLTGSPVRAIERANGGWRLRTDVREVTADIVVNAGGAWGDTIANLAGVRGVGLMPLRRTAVTFGIDHPLAGWPVVHEVEHRFYFKPEAGQLLLSPADEDPSPPCDAQPDELTVAVAVSRFEETTTVSVSRLTRRWAGLRTFAADRVPVVGFDDRMDGFFWLVGQGGVGVQTGPAMGRLAAALLAGRGVPDDIRGHGVDAARLGPARPALRNE